MAFINLVTPQNVATGIGQVLFLAPLDYFYKVQQPEPPFYFPGASVTIFDDHIFKAGKNFLQLLLTEEKNDFTAKTVGEEGNYSLDQNINALIPGSYADLHEFIKNIINQPVIALAKDANCPANLYYQVGTACNPAYFTGNFETGTTKDGMKGYSCSINAYGAAINLYAGEIMLDAAVGTIIQTEDGNDLLTEDGKELEVE